jgi:hypothetical protein
MPATSIKFLAKEVREAVVSEVDSAFSTEGFSDVDERVWVADVPDYAEDPYAAIEISDVVPSPNAESKDCAAEAVFVDITIYATENGTDSPYDDVEALAKQVTQNMTGGFSISGHTVFEVRLNAAQPVSSTGPEQVDLFGRGLQFEIDLE